MNYTYVKNHNRLYHALLLLFCILVLFCSGCGVSQRAEPQTYNQEEQKDKEAPVQYRSDTTPEDCRLCGDGKGTLLPLYWGQDNVGIISLNTFMMLSVETNRYNDRGKLIKEPAPSSSTHSITSGKDGFMASVSEDSDKGYAHGYVYFGNDEILDMEKAAAFLCTECLNRIMGESWDTPYGIGSVNFKTREIRLLEENVTAFIFDDFYISCDLRNRGTEEKPEMDLLIFYCPERYK